MHIIETGASITVTRTGTHANLTEP